MGFLSFSLKYYTDKIQQYETGVMSEAELYEARQLLKMLEDLLDEGYTSLVDALEAQNHGVSRLRNVLSEKGVNPFAMPEKASIENQYSKEEYELTALIEAIVAEAKQKDLYSENPFLKKLQEYAQWIGQEENTAYVFLLRDALLPYIVYKEKSSEV